MPDVPAFDVENAPLEEFADPQSAIASILNQMQGAANRSRPIETIQHANRPVSIHDPIMRAPDDLIRMLLEGAAGGAAPGKLSRFYGR